MPQLIVFAGLPGSGKTTLAKLLAPRIGAVILNKDEVRASLFAPEHVEYSDRQNDFCMEVIYQLAKYHFAVRPERPVIIDGRTFGKQSQIQRLLDSISIPLDNIKFILCTATLEQLENRVLSQSDHLARDRTMAMVRQASARIETLAVPLVTIDTTEGNVLDHVLLLEHAVKTKRDQ